MKKVQKWLYNALPVVGMLYLWWETSRLSSLYLDSPYIGAFIGFWLWGWVLTYKDENKKE